MDNKKRIILGIGVLIIGIVFLFSTFVEKLSILYIWPAFLLIPIIFLISDFVNLPQFSGNKLESIVFLSELMIFLFVWTIAFNYKSMDKLWPFFLIMPGVASLLSAIFNKKGKKILSSLFLIIIGIFLLAFSFGIYSIEFAIPVALIILGTFILTMAIFSSFKKKEKK